MTRKKLTVRRKAYKREAYTRKDGTRVKSAWVGSSMFKIADRGAVGRGKKLFDIKKGLLSKHGYAARKSKRARRLALGKADKVYGSVRLWRMLHAQAILRKRTNGVGEIFASDRDWVRDVKLSGREARSMTRPAVKEWEAMSPFARRMSRM